MTKFRQLASRIVSLHNDLRDQVTMTPALLNEERHHVVKFAKANDFAAGMTAADPRVAIYVHNQHVWQLTRSPRESVPGHREEAQSIVFRTMSAFQSIYL